MKPLIDSNFLLFNETAQQLYHNTAKHMPIIDYHNHLVPEEIAEDKTFENISKVWLSGDHYKWRAMRANAISEEYITGDKSDYEKFLAWAETVPKMIGNPLYHWTHMELKRYFDIDTLLNEETAPMIWEDVNRQLNTPEMSARSLLKQKNVEFVGTTDDPTDSLETHAALQKEDFGVQVSPSFRPDKALQLENNDFNVWLKKLEQAADVSIEHYDDFLTVLEKRVAYFDKHGCRSSDHGINVMFYESASFEEVCDVFEKRLQDRELTQKEIDKFKTYTLMSLGEMYADKEWVMQLHMGPLRNNNTRMFNKLGPDSGFDSIGDRELAVPLGHFLDALEQKEKLPKTVLYSLNQKDYYVLASMAGNFQNDEIPGKIQFGTAWWFNDQIEGMEHQMSVLANVGLISNFIGMLTDSRSFLSFPRHEYFRRILCNLLGKWVEEGKAPNDMKLLDQYVQDICYNNAKRYFNL
ncbi:uronate isomerase [Lentibacillus kapialis]|uniref:Uronate isomerase n=1 Tax=Lentibacillus kapialis TaxID=340214 RepID=A0A917PQT5_9BACI|nr:glucuronate isomerase [Lentibacillus kapialis]GGJ87728.1 uronate isomerase [Lentibacillus kapialis]